MSDCARFGVEISLGPAIWRYNGRQNGRRTSGSHRRVGRRKGPGPHSADGQRPSLGNPRGLSPKGRGKRDELRRVDAEGTVGDSGSVAAQPATAPASGPAGAPRVRPPLPAGAHCCVRQAVHRGWGNGCPVAQAGQPGAGRQRPARTDRHRTRGASGGERSGQNRVRRRELIRVYRIVREPYSKSPLDGEGSYRFGGRWSSPGTRLAYTAEHL